jgi:hypothetical protein
MPSERRINAYLAFFFVILLTAFLFHQDRAFPGSAPGHSLGIMGSIFMLMSLIYSFRKRVLKKKGTQNPLSCVSMKRMNTALDAIPSTWAALRTFPRLITLFSTRILPAPNVILTSIRVGSGMTAGHATALLRGKSLASAIPLLKKENVTCATGPLLHTRNRNSGAGYWKDIR